MRLETQHETITRWKVIRIMHNPGVLCYANCIFQSLCWMALHTGYIASDCWSDDGAIFTLLTKMDKTAVSIPSHEAFLEVMTQWCITRNIRQQHDAAEFLQHLLQWLKPACWNAEWIPPWYLGVFAQSETEVEKGDRWAVMHFNIGSYPDDTPLQLFIDHWHDAGGHQNELTDGGRGFAFHLERLVAPDYTRKSLMKPLQFPCVSEDVIAWKKFKICGINLHKGPNYQSGHFFSTFHSSDRERWFHYDVGRIPTVTHDEKLLRLTHMMWVTPLAAV